MKLVKPQRFIIFLAIIVISIIYILALYTQSETITEYKTYTVQSEDSIWSIANEHYISKDIRKEVHEIQKHNGLYGEQFFIRAGQEIEIPIKDNMR